MCVCFFLITASYTLIVQNHREEVILDVSDEALLELYQGARVTDVVYGLVTCGYMDVGMMDPFNLAFVAWCANN